MTTATLTLNGLEAHLTLDHGVNTTGAYGILFDEDGDTVAETESTRYSGYCTFCILYREAIRVFGYRRQIESGDIADALNALGYHDLCDDDDAANHDQQDCPGYTDDTLTTECGFTGIVLRTATDGKNTDNGYQWQCPKCEGTFDWEPDGD